MRLEAHGLRLDLPPGWEGRIYRRDDPDARPVVHAASFPLAASDDDFAVASAGAIPAAGALMVVCEYDSALAGEALFAPPPPPALDPAQASPTHLLRRLPGQAGYQRFFNTSGRAFGLYVVIGSVVQAHAAVSRVNDVLGSLVVS